MKSICGESTSAPFSCFMCNTNFDHKVEANLAGRELCFRKNIQFKVEQIVQNNYLTFVLRNCHWLAFIYSGLKTEVDFPQRDKDS